MRKKIQDKSIAYSILKSIVHFLLFLFYRKIEIKGLENIHNNKHKAIIFAPNHQNALMDALLILYVQPGRSVFLARADIFKKKTIANILNFLRILPVYRIRDGIEELDKNFDIFNKSVDVLRDDVPLCLMPEGRQSFKRQLLPLVKGIFRIAFQAQEVLPEKEVIIIPVGIDYTSYTRPFTDVVIRFGEPIPVNKYQEEYEKQPARALNLLRNETSEQISSLIQDIRSKDHYYDFYGISKIEQKNICKKHGWKQTPLNLLRARQETTLMLDKMEEVDPVEAQTLCNDYLVKYPNLRSHEKKGQEFKSSFTFVIILVIFLLIILGGIITLISALL